MQDLWPHAYVHALNPFLFKLTEEFGIRWYGLSYLAGFVLGYYFILWLAKRRLTVLKPEEVSDFVFSVAIGTVVGGRLGYCIFYSPHLFTQFTSNVPFWGVLAINQGGMASHGGIFGIIVACLWYARRHGYSALALFDLTTIGGSLGILFGRIANFINGELVGRAAPPDLKWAVKFPQDIVLWPSEEPGRLSALAPVVQKLGIPADEWADLVARRMIGPNQVDGVLHRIVTSIQDGNTAVKSVLAPLLTGRHPSQLYEALLEGAFLFVVLLLIWSKPRKQGIIAGFFLTLYPLVRIIGEQFRMPDPGIGYQLLGLTRGQWLSVIMIAITSGLLLYWSERPGPKLGGWYGRKDDTGADGASRPL